MFFIFLCLQISSISNFRLRSVAPENIVVRRLLNFKSYQILASRLISETVALRCPVKKVFLEILQNSQENAYNFIRKKTLAQVFPCEFWEISNNTFFKKHLWWLLLKSKEFSNLGMELQVKRTFKSHIFLSPKKQCNSRQLA